MSTPPNWDHVPFDVGCARCGHDLRDLTEPKCPQCELEFDWADAVPIEELTCLLCDYHLYGLVETRCPECGQAFSWEEVLDDYRRRKKPLFEYRWRERPVHSFVHTWLWALWPRKLWSKMDIHDPPRVLPLLGMVAVALILFALSMAVLEGLHDWLWRVRMWRGAQGPSVSEIPTYILHACYDRYLLDAFVSTVVWMSVSFVSLMIYRQSMRRCKVRTVHVVRTWAYGIPLMLPLVSVVSYIPAFINAMAGKSHFPNLDPQLSLLFLCHVTYSLHRAYKTYLGMRHSAAVAVASQLVAVLGTGAVYFAVMPQRFGQSFAIDILQTLGLW